MILFNTFLVQQKVGRKMNCIQKGFLMWIFDKEKNTKYWANRMWEKEIALILTQL